MKKIIMFILLITLSLSITGCVSHKVRVEMEDKFDAFTEHNNGKRYIIVTISKGKLSLGGPFGLQTEAKKIIIVFDRIQDETTILKEEYFDSKGTEEHTDEFKDFVFDFPFDVKDIDHYDEESESYSLEMKTDDFMEIYENWFYICEMDQGSESLTLTRVQINSPEDSEYTWFINRSIRGSNEVGDYPLYQTNVKFEYSNSLS